MHHQGKFFINREARNQFQLPPADAVGRVRRNSYPDEPIFKCAQLRDLLSQLRDILAGKSCVGTKRFLIDDAPQADFSLSLHWLRTRRTSVAQASHARARCFIAPQVADTSKSSALIARRARVSLRSQAKKSFSSRSRNPRITVSSRCECVLTKPGRIAASPKSSVRESGNLETISVRGPTAIMLELSNATAPSSIN